MRWRSSMCAAAAVLALSCEPNTGRFPAVANLEQPGAFTPISVNATGPNARYTTFYPSQLGSNGVKHPIVTWGNGALSNPSVYSRLLNHLASHGFVIIAF